SRVAERNAAVHTARGLSVQFLIAIRFYKFIVRLFAGGYGGLFGEGPFKFLKSGWFSHLSVSIVVYASTNFERSTFLYSRGNTLINDAFSFFQFFRMNAARLLPVRWMCRLSKAMIAVSSSVSSG